MSFWRRLAQFHGAFLVKEISRLIPQESAAGILVYRTRKGAAMGDIQVLDTDGSFAAAAVFVDAEGNPTDPTNVVWASDNEAVATVTGDASGATITVVGAGGLGAAVISAVDTNPDGTTATAQGTVTVVASDATTGEVTFTPPSQTAAPAGP